MRRDRTSARGWSSWLLPAHHASNAQNGQTIGLPMAETRRILVVDDSPDMRALIAHYLAELGLEVVQADTGEAALRAVRGGGIDLVVLDVMLPDLSGFEICRRMKSDPASVLIPVVL